jgi:hypothetical protein
MPCCSTRLIPPHDYWCFVSCVLAGLQLTCVTAHVSVHSLCRLQLDP